MSLRTSAIDRLAQQIGVASAGPPDLSSRDPDQRETEASRPCPGARPPEDEDRIIELADLDWCSARLRSTDHGVLTSRRLGTPASLGVDYTVDASRVAVAVAPGQAVLHLLTGGEVTLELTGRTPDDRVWLVRLTGAAHLAPAPAGPADEPASGNSHLASDVASGASPSTLLISVYRLRGYYEMPLDDLATTRP